MIATEKGHKPRARSLRNKIVTALTAVATAAPTIEAIPGLVPPGTGVAVAQGLGLIAVLINQFMPDTGKRQQRENDPKPETQP
jgi:hypothetical protein